VFSFVLRRLLLSIPVLFGVVLLVFSLARLLPGDPCTAAYGERATEAVCTAFEQRYGLDRPVIPFLIKDGEEVRFTSDVGSVVDNQFVSYLGQLARGDLGDSIRQGRPVAEILLERFPATLELTLYALIFAVVFGVLLGLISASRRNSPADVGTMVVANLGVSTPVFVLGLVLAYIFAVVLRGTPFALPPSGRTSPGVIPEPLWQAWGWAAAPEGPFGVFLEFIGNIYTLNALLTVDFVLLGDVVVHMLMPMVALGTISMAIIARMTRSSLLDVLGLEYVRTARAKGMSERLVLYRHALRNALLPVVTVIGLSLGALLSGAVLTETIFNIAGLGRTITEAIEGRDYIVVQGLTLITAVIYILVNLLVDVSYARLDPRIRLR
jgi:peptide/nickel transport system permease protein